MSDRPRLIGTPQKVGPEPPAYPAMPERVPKRNKLRRKRGEQIRFGRYTFRRLVWRFNKDTKEQYQIDDPWSWKPTQRPPARTRADNRRRNRRSRAARKISARCR